MRAATEAVRLFADRASAVLPVVRPSPMRTSQAVAWISHKLDGIPLAIELAAGSRVGDVAGGDRDAGSGTGSGC